MTTSMIGSEKGVKKPVRCGCVEHLLDYYLHNHKLLFIARIIKLRQHITTSVNSCGGKMYSS